MKENKDLSSGAEKVEKIARRRGESQGDAANGGVQASEERRREAAAESAAARENARA